MSETAELKAHTPTRRAEEVIRTAQIAQAANGVCYTSLGETALGRQSLVVELTRLS